MGKLVKKAELTILGTLGIILFSSTHLPGLLSSLDQPAVAAPETFTASVYEAVYSGTIPAPTIPVADSSKMSASSTEDISSDSDLSSDSPAQIFVQPSSDNIDPESAEVIDPIDPIQ